MENYLLRNGLELPKIGFGTYKLNGFTGAKTISTAIKNGYRLLDTAYNYENEGAVGRGIADSGIDRSDLIVTTKIPGRYYQHDQLIQTLQESLYRAHLDYFDIVLLHWPNPKDDHYVEAFKALIEAKKWGLVRTIGVCNFLPEHLDRLEKETGELPEINQIELHPSFNQVDQRKYNEEHQILTEAWSPLGRASEVLQDPTLTKIANKYQKNVGQIILRWEVQLNVLPIPKSSTPTRQRGNKDVFDFELTDEEMEIINQMTKPDGRIANQDPAVYQEF
ncbi:aldo/keto reductase [Lactobacillus sp. S2-2]|uniref:aldo/keto reductase n=1 Tax=Lactobacillus sp. S2-2 TaxID=2692917 RepID=UPI001F3BA702|nr:aldo/keto reductase [Lactobacillus sp. S2-2]MCF6515591.1 aldo/keto reductase [Lactobacillus sp. S2-2]